MGLPVVAGGVPVATGDLVCGDADGVVVVPRPRLEEVGARLAAVAEAERAAEANVEAAPRPGRRSRELLASSRVRWID